MCEIFMIYEIGFLIPYRVDKIKNWKEKLENEINKIDEIIEKFNLPHIFTDSIKAAGAAQFIKEQLGETDIIIEISVEPRLKKS